MPNIMRGTMMPKLWQRESILSLKPFVRPSRYVHLQLTALDSAQSIEDMDLPGFRLHRLKGFKPPRLSIWVNGNWRQTFEFSDGNAYMVNYEDYH